MATDPFQVRTQLQMGSCAGCGAAQYPTGLAWCGCVVLRVKKKPPTASYTYAIGCFVWSLSLYSPTWSLALGEPELYLPRGGRGEGCHHTKLQRRHHNQRTWLACAILPLSFRRMLEVLNHSLIDGLVCFTLSIWYVRISYCFGLETMRSIVSGSSLAAAVFAPEP